MSNVIDIDRTLGTFGLFLMLVVARLTDRAYGGSPTVPGRVTGFLARRVIDGVAAIGWIVDRLPLPQQHVKRTGGGSPVHAGASAG